MSLKCAALNLSVVSRMLTGNERLECVAPSLDGKGLVTLTIAQERVQQLSKVRRLTPLFELFYNVCGVRPPVNLIGHHEKDLPPFPDGWGGLRHTHAIYRGIRRPMNGDGFDHDVYIYVVQPRYVYRSIVDTACLAKRYDAPKDSVFVAYVVFDDANCTAGRILNWEWVEADMNQRNLPNDAQGRYDNRVWSNG